MTECCNKWRCFSERRCTQESDDWHRLLRARRERPCRRTEQRDELATFHSITSSARSSSVGGTVRPSALAVFRLISIAGNKTWAVGSGAGLAEQRPGAAGWQAASLPRGRRSDPDLAMKDFTPYRTTTMAACL